MKKIFYLIAVSSLLLIGLKSSAQSISFISPSNGNVGTTISYASVYCSNTNFTSATSNGVSLVKSGSASIIGTSVYAYNDTELDAEFIIPSSATPGYYNVVITNNIDGTITKVNGFQVTNYPATLYSISPSTGNVGITVYNASVSGNYTNFDLAGSNTISLVKSGSTSIVGTNIYAYNDTWLEADFVIPSGATTGYYDVVISNSIDGTITKTNGFQVTNYPASLSSVYPSSANVGEIINYGSIYGNYTNFDLAGSNTVSLVKSGSPSIIATNVDAYTNTSLDVEFVIPITATPGYYDVIVSNSIDGTITKSNGFQVTNYPPTISYVSPSTGQAGKTTNYVNIDGDYTHFQQAVSNSVSLVKTGSPTILGTGLYVGGNTYLSANFNIPKTAATGFYDVVVSNSIDGTIKRINGFNITAPTTIVSIMDSVAERGQTLSPLGITIINNVKPLTQCTVKTWLSNLSTGGRIDGTGVAATGNNTIDATFKIPVAAPYGRWDLFVTLSDSYYPYATDTVIKSGGFRVKAPVGIENIGKIPDEPVFFPNPFSNDAILTYDLSSASLVEISIFNILGEKLKVFVSNYQSAGTYELTIPGKELKDNGIYFISIQTGNNRKMIKIIKQ